MYPGVKPAGLNEKKQTQNFSLCEPTTGLSPSTYKTQEAQPVNESLKSTTHGLKFSQVLYGLADVNGHVTTGIQSTKNRWIGRGFHSPSVWGSDDSQMETDRHSVHIRPPMVESGLCPYLLYISGVDTDLSTAFSAGISRDVPLPSRQICWPSPPVEKNLVRALRSDLPVSFSRRTLNAPLWSSGCQ